MTDALHALRPEVREAFLYFNRFKNHPPGWPTIRAELLRLAAAEAELAALKARIADAPIATLMLTSGAGDLTLVWAENPDEWAGKTVRLIVEE